jgi:hypothetical protein
MHIINGHPGVPQDRLLIVRPALTTFDPHLSLQSSAGWLYPMQLWDVVQSRRRRSGSAVPSAEPIFEPGGQFSPHRAINACHLAATETTSLWTLFRKNLGYGAVTAP